MNEIKFSATRHRISDNAAVAIGVILFKAKQTGNRFGGSNDGFSQGLLRRGSHHVRGEYPTEV